VPPERLVCVKHRTYYNVGSRCESCLAEERSALAIIEQEEKAMASMGAVRADLSKQDEELIREIVKCGIIAKQTSRTVVSVRVWNEGKQQILAEPIGNYDTIFLTLLQRLRGQVGSSRRES